MSKVTPDVDGFSRKVWLKDVRVSPRSRVWVGVIPLKGGGVTEVTLVKPKGWELDTNSWKFN